MIIIQPRAELISEPDNIKRIEIAGRTCYKSEDKIRTGSADEFVKRLIRRGHEAMLEHSNIIVCFDDANDYFSYIAYFEEYEEKTGKKVNLRKTLYRQCSYDAYSRRGIISGNIRAWRDFGSVCHDAVVPLTGVLELNSGCRSGLEGYIVDEESLTPEERYVHGVRTVRIICDRGVSHELVRHRVFSFAQESTRYCDYSGSMLFVSPWWYERAEPAAREEFHRALCLCEEYYKILRSMDLPPQAARAVLVNALKTEVVMTGTLQMWDGFFALRCDAAAHPDMQIVAGMTKLLFSGKGMRYAEQS